MQVGLATFQIADKTFKGCSVVAREQNECIVRDFQLIELVKELADFGVHVPTMERKQC